MNKEEHTRAISYARNFSFFMAQERSYCTTLQSVVDVSYKFVISCVEKKKIS